MPGPGAAPLTPRRATGNRVVLASASPRRLELLTRLGIVASMRAPEIDETPRPGERAEEYVMRLSIEKAATVDDREALVIAADTTVELDGRLLGKPVDAADAVQMLRSLSARTHRVHTGVTVRFDGREATDVATTSVAMVPITAATANWYVDTGEPLDKAGAYAVQGIGSVFVDHVRGSVTNVVGLPLTLLIALAQQVGRPLLPASS